MATLGGEDSLTEDYLLGDCELKTTCQGRWAERLGAAGFVAPRKDAARRVGGSDPSVCLTSRSFMSGKKHMRLPSVSIAQVREYAAHNTLTAESALPGSHINTCKYC